MKAFVRLTVLLAVLSLISCRHGQYSVQKAIKRGFETSARLAALEWLELLDRGDYDSAYLREPARLHAAVTLRQFQRSMEARREPFGRTISRQFVGARYQQRLTGAPDADYESILFKSSFEHKVVAAERLILVRETKGWRIVDYRLY